jgi:hypothetical protein
MGRQGSVLSASAASTVSRLSRRSRSSGGRSSSYGSSIDKTRTASVAPTANSSRFEVQQSYEQLYFERTEEEVSDSSRWNKLAFEDFDDRADGIAMLKRRLRAASGRLAASADASSGGDCWRELFQLYDADGSGELDEEELSRAVRRDLNIREHELSDADLRRLFVQIDADGSGTISAEELVEFMSWKSTTPPGSGAKRRGSDDDQSHLPFVAEFIAMKGLVMREGASIHSPKVGRIAKGEIVAVMRAVGNRLRVERLRVNVQPRRGWVTEWDDRAGEAFLEMLPREEWGDSAYNDTVSRGFRRVGCSFAEAWLRRVSGVPRSLGSIVAMLAVRAQQPASGQAKLHSPSIVGGRYD